MSTGLKLTFATVIILSFIATGSALEPSHPLSQINPIDRDLNLDGYNINNVDMLKLNASGNHLVLQGNTISDSGNFYVVRLNSSTGRLELINTDLNVRNNNISSSTDGNISFAQDSRTHGELWVPRDTLKFNNRSALSATTGLAKALQINNSAGQYLIDMNGNRIINLGDPVNSQDAVNKQYLEQYVANNDATGTDNQSLSIDTSTINDTISIENGNSVQIFDNYDPNTDSQILSFNADVSGTSDEISISNGNTITLDDDFEANTDNQQLSVTHNNLNDQISLENGGTITIQDNNTDADANPSNEIQSLSEVLNQGNTAGSYTIDMNGNVISGVANPSNPQDAATKDYVDSNEETIADNQTLAEVLAQGRTADRDIDMDGYSVVNTLAFEGENGQDLRSDFDGGSGFMFESPGNTRILELNADGEVEIPSGNLNLRGNNITNLDYVKFEEGTSINGDLTVNGSIDTTGDLDLQDHDLLDTNTVQANTLEDPEDGTLVVNDNLDMNDNELQNVLNIKSTSNNDLRIGAGAGGSDRVRIRDNANSQDIAEFEEGTQNVYVPNGNLDVNSPSNTGGALDVGGQLRTDGLVNIAAGNNLDFGGVNWRVQDDTGNNRLDIQDRIGTNTDVIRLNNGGNVDIPNGAVSIGSNPAQTGTIRLENGDVITARKASDSGDTNLIYLDGGDEARINDGNLVVHNSGEVVVPNNDLQVGGNNIDNIANLYQDNSQTNFFQSDCSPGSVVIGIDSDGTYNCASTSSQVTDIWVNESGDTMTGNLNMNENEIQGIDRLQDNVGTTTVEFDGSNNVLVPSGNLVASGSSAVGETAFEIQSSDGQSLSFVETSSGSQNNIALENPDGTQLFRWPDSVSRTWATAPIEMRSDNMIRTGGGGGTQTGFYDSANTQNILVAQEGGKVRVPNGNIEASQGIDVGSVGVASTAGEVTVENGLSFSNNAVSINRGTRSASGSSLVLDSYEDTLVYSANGVGNVAWFRSNGSVEIPNGGLSMNGNNITAVDYLKFEDGTSIGDGELAALNSIDGTGGTIKISDNLDMQDNDIQDVSNLYMDDSQSNFFNDSCGAGSVITSINSDGTFNCASTSGQVTDIWVNETGDVMTGDLNFSNNNINEVESIDSDGSTTNLDLVDGGDVNIPNGNLDVNSPSNTGGALDVGGQIKSDNGVDTYGNVNVNENEIQNVDRLEDNAGTATINFDGANNVDIPNGNLRMNDNNVDNVASIDGGGDAVRVDDNIDTNGNSLTSSGGEMCIGDQCA